ncbi:hypothetical protein V495_04426 [Pseudogymnoascus sp. VKM F-4514 (FW-929)]|nr:hypothetical protein V495_04426 [Pseudogymnoascus sp. VKM F-4514 (FW-929)]KFY51376.1 hypothetical protein V497_09188 [Pseudogymnoascus sp. VKM F-4516 (FW-969)]
MDDSIKPAPSVTPPLIIEPDATPSASRQPQPHPRRNRSQLSCTHCRHAKLKCDRNQPCLQCVKRGRDSQCSFPPPVAKRKPAASMQNRLKHLQSLLKDVMAGQAPAGQPTPPSEGHGDEIASNIDPALSREGSSSHNDFSQSMKPDAKDELRPSTGQVLLGTHQTTYVGATHWAAILDDVEEIHSYFEETEDADFIADDGTRPDMSLLFRPGSNVTKLDLIAALPQKSVVDRLVSRYFNSNSPAIHIIHRPTFQKEYNRFWADPSSTPVSWLGLLYALMCLATLAALGAGEENMDPRGTPTEMIRTYRGCSSQCLVLSNYSQPGAYTLEVLLVYIEGEFVLSKDDMGMPYILVGVAVRLALRMGLHRDPSNVGGGLTPYQGEMRRRLWHILIQVDLLCSFLLGLPVTTQAIESDTAYPRNLRDEDFDENSAELPPSRPESEITPMSYTICKSRICEVFGKVGVLANRMSLPSYDEVMELDGVLQEAEAGVPEFIRLKPLEMSITDPASVIIQRYSIALLLQKCRCMLHRKHIETEPYSKKVSIEAAMELLSYQSSIHLAALPGGPLALNRWFLSSLSVHDFLLAGMIVYSRLTQVVKGSPNEHRSSLDESLPSREEMVAALQKSHLVWIDTQTMSANAEKGSRILGAMMKNANLATGSVPGSTSTPIGGIERASTMPGGPVSISGLSLNDAMGPVLPVSAYGGQQWALDPSDTIMQTSEYTLQPSLDSLSTPSEPLEAILASPGNFDWETFDSHIWPGLPQNALDQGWPNLDFDYQM